MKKLSNISIIILASVWIFSVNAFSMQVPIWSVNPSDYEHFMTVTGMIVLNGTATADSSFWIGAFSGDQCRGVAKPVLTQAKWIIFLLTYGNTQGEQLQFKAFHSTDGKLYSITEGMQFQVSASIGQPASPFIFHGIPITGVAGVSSLNIFALDQNYPNPFNPSTTISYRIPEQSKVRLSIFNTLGQLISEIVNETKDAGSYLQSFDASQLSSGVYYYRIESLSANNTKTFVETKKMILMQ